jgi:hypothetical protein
VEDLDLDVGILPEGDDDAGRPRLGLHGDSAGNVYPSVPLVLQQARGCIQGSRVGVAADVEVGRVRVIGLGVLGQIAEVDVAGLVGADPDRVTALLSRPEDGVSDLFGKARNLRDLDLLGIGIGTRSHHRLGLIVTPGGGRKVDGPDHENEGGDDEGPGARSEPGGVGIDRILFRGCGLSVVHGSSRVLF